MRRSFIATLTSSMNQTGRKSSAERIEMIMHGGDQPPSTKGIAQLRKVRAEIRAFLEAEDPAPNEVREAVSQEFASHEAQEPASHDAQEPASHEASESASHEAQEPSSVDAAWMVMEAANDFGDQATIDACRRVIDASLNGATAAHSDVAVVNNYFK
jgi:hypothetical protein